jgi:hypothetical protein
VKAASIEEYGSGRETQTTTSLQEGRWAHVEPVDPRAHTGLRGGKLGAQSSRSFAAAQQMQRNSLLFII